jgi:hypothetical protein
MKALDLEPLLDKKEDGTLTVEDLLESNDAVTDLKNNSNSQLADM